MNTKNRRRGSGEWITGVAQMADVRTIQDAVCFVAMWPALGMIAWMAIDPYGFRDAVLRVLGVL